MAAHRLPHLLSQYQTGTRTRAHCSSLLLRTASPHQHLALHLTHNTQLTSLPSHLHLTSHPDRVSSALLPFCLRFLACLSQGSMRIWGFLGTESYPPTCRQSVPPQPPFRHSVPPQPPLGHGVRPQPQGALPPPLGQSVIQARRPTFADFDRRQSPPPHPTFPAAVPHVQSPP